MTLTDFRTLGRSGLVVSPLALGTMTFGAATLGLRPPTTSATVFDAYVEAGGNLVDTADVYAGGRSEETVGQLVAERGLRDRIVIATKAGFHAKDPGNPNAGGNGRKHVVAALEGSLKRLGTDYIDLYWMHVWDGVTPPEETLHTMGDLIRQGKVRYFGLSDGPAWVTTKTATLAQAWGVPGPVAIQPEYSLVERSIEREHVGAARDNGLGIVPWSPLAGGFLTGKYRRGDAPDAGRLSVPNPLGDSKFTDRNWGVLNALRSVADAGRGRAGVAPRAARRRLGSRRRADGGAARKQPRLAEPRPHGRADRGAERGERTRAGLLDDDGLAGLEGGRVRRRVGRGLAVARRCENP